MFAHKIAKKSNSAKQHLIEEKGSTTSKAITPFDNILSLHKTLGNRAVQRLMESGALQTKLTVGKPNDIYEQEADRVAETVMRMAEPDVSGKAHEAVSLQPIEEKEDELQRQPMEDEEELRMQPIEEEEELQMQPMEEEEEVLQTKRVTSETPNVGSDIESSIYAQKGGGQPLSQSSQGFFGSRFGADFTGVRIHTNDESDSLNQSLNARAFTTGQDIFFRKGEYNPGSSTGKELLAHELTHVVQQNGGDRLERKELDKKPKSGCACLSSTSVHRKVQRKLMVGKSDDIYEKEADYAAERVMRMPDNEATALPLLSGQNNVPLVQAVCTECEEELQRKSEDESVFQTEENISRGPPDQMAKNLEDSNFNTEFPSSDYTNLTVPTPIHTPIAQRVCTECEEELQRKSEDEKPVEPQENSSRAPPHGTGKESQQLNFNTSLSSVNGIGSAVSGRINTPLAQRVCTECEEEVQRKPEDEESPLDQELTTDNISRPPPREEPSGKLADQSVKIRPPPGTAKRGLQAAGRVKAQPLVQRKCGKAINAPPTPDCTPETVDPVAEIFRFKVNCDEIEPAEATHVTSFVSGLSSGTSLKVHGYASSDGPPVFNLKLSCHRANEMARILRAAAPTFTITGVFKHGPVPGPASIRRAAWVETVTPPPSPPPSPPTRALPTGPFLDMQIACVTDAGGCSNPASIPSLDTQCRTQTGYTGLALVEADLVCATPGMGIAESLDRAYPTWRSVIPNCPCTRADAEAASNFSRDRNPFLSQFHPGADVCFRSDAVASVPGTEHRQQCCYTRGGMLITQGGGAGTPDVWEGFFRHQRIDVQPFNEFNRDSSIYNRFWVPNPGVSCPSSDPCINRCEQQFEECGDGTRCLARRSSCLAQCRPP